MFSLVSLCPQGKGWVSLVSGPFWVGIPGAKYTRGVGIPGGLGIPGGGRIYQGVGIPVVKGYTSYTHP